MSDHELDQEMVEIAMSIIVDAGDARRSIGEAFAAISRGDFDECDAKLLNARKLLAQAHGKQTDIIQSEGEGELRQHPLLFIHAQDTLMTINSELTICKHMIGVCKNYEQRIAQLEKGCSCNA